MYHRGQGVTKSPAHAFMWLSFAAARGDSVAKGELKAVSGAMSPEEVSRAREIIRTCEASDYRDCEY